jgi:hypothetical protein
MTQSGHALHDHRTPVGGLTRGPHLDENKEYRTPCFSASSDVRPRARFSAHGRAWGDADAPRASSDRVLPIEDRPRLCRIVFAGQPDKSLIGGICLFAGNDDAAVDEPP